MKKAVIKEPFSVIQWHGEDYPFYQSDAEESTFQRGDEVLILHEAKPNPMGKIYVVFSEKKNEATTVAEDYLEMIPE